jgi:hypothetical protein
MEQAKTSREIGEFDLIDYVRVVWRWRWLILAGTIAGVLVAVLLTSLSSPTYRVAATIDAGDLKEARDRDLERLVARLNAGLIDEPAPAGERVGVTAQYRKPYTIELSAESPRPAGGVAAVERAAAAALADLSRLHEIQRIEEGVRESALQSRLEALRREQSFREDRLKILRRGLEHLEQARAAWARPPVDPAAALVYAQLSEQIATRASTVAQLEDQIRVQTPRELEDVRRELKLAQLSAHVRPPRLAAGARAAATGRRPWLPLALGTVVGLAGSVLLAVACEYYARGTWRLAAPVREPASRGERATPGGPGP